MQPLWTDRRFLLFPAVTLLLISTLPAFAQRGGAGSSGAGASAGSASPGNIGGSTGTRGNTGSIPGTNTPFPNSTTTNPDMNRPIFLSGKVMFDDGTPANTDIRIERVCSGQPHLESHTDSKGRFYFQLGQNTMVDTDASDAMMTPIGTPNQQGNGQWASSGRMSGLGGMGSGLFNCELRAAYPGYRSDLVELSTRRSMDDPNVGTIVLHRLQNVKGTTISVTSALAPKKAQKDYEKGMQLASKGKFDEAEEHFANAVDLYPKYAIAWYALGQLQARNNKGDEARKSFENAISADKNYVNPYNQLALLSAQGSKWEDAASYSSQVISLNPVEFPSAYWYNALANYNLKKGDLAEKSARELVKLDTAHKYPEAESLLAQLSLDQGKYPEAAAHLRSYLALAPNAKNADALKQMLLKIDQASAGQQK
ncbi:MAG: tetratricopeptide repeat protein [Acidobacteriaceae bacterium]|nr:tetratricopeptide repeat protein [Acidobacteriaceae bacterium]